MKRLPHLPLTAVTAILSFAPLAPRQAVPADVVAKLGTQAVRIKLPPENGSGDWSGRPEILVELIRLPPGKIALRGADGRDHEHAVKPIWIAKYETRWDEYDVFYLALDLPAGERRKVMGDREQRPRVPYMPPDGGWEWDSPGHDGYPANCIHFQAAAKYCAWLSKHTGKKFRLPTDAEWEYACRAGGPPVTPDPKRLDAVAWFADNANGKTHAAGKKQPNAWGLYDMLGNVGEYVIRDPTDKKGLLAGGSFKDLAKDVHSSAREPYSPDWQKFDPEEPKETSWLNWTVHHVGFRVVMED